MYAFTWGFLLGRDYGQKKIERGISGAREAGKEISRVQVVKPIAGLWNCLHSFLKSIESYTRRYIGHVL